MVHASGIFSDAQAVTTGNIASSNSVQGDAADAEVEINVDTAFVTADAATLKIHLQECATVGGSYTDVLVSKAYSAAELAKSGVAPLLLMKVPRSRLAFLKMLYEVVSGTFSAGKVNVNLITRQM